MIILFISHKVNMLFIRPPLAIALLGRTGKAIAVIHTKTTVVTRVLKHIFFYHYSLTLYDANPSNGNFNVLLHFSGFHFRLQFKLHSSFVISTISPLV